MAKQHMQNPAIPEDIQAIFDSLPTVETLDADQAESLVDFSADPGFVADALKMQVVEDVLKAMKEQGLNKNTLAEKLGKSRQYVSRILNETANFTVESLAEIACVLGMRISVHLYNRDERLEILPWHPDFGKEFALIDLSAYEKQEKRIDYHLENADNAGNLVA